MNQLSRTSYPSATPRSGLVWLIAAAVGTVVFWQVPWGGYVVYPFTILATWFHEMGHGLTALLLGGEFEGLLLFPDGSGVALHRGPVFGGLFGRAFVSASGPLGPSVAGALLILAGKRENTSRLCLLLLGGLMAVSTALWVRSFFGLIAVPFWSALILLIGLKGPDWLRMFFVQLLGVQACVSVYHQMGYLFTEEAVIGGTRVLTDTGHMADSLLLPHWFWGALLGIASFLLLAASLWLTYRKKT